MFTNMRTKLKFIILLLISILGLRGVAKAQLYHVKGEKGANIGIGLNKNGLNPMILYQKMFQKNMKYSVGSDLYFSNVGVTKDRKFFVDGKYYYTIFDIKQKVFFEGMVGIGLGVESMKDEVSNEKNTSFCIKEEVGMNVEYCVLEKFSINLVVKQVLFQLNRNGNGIFSLGLGTTIKF